jgi:hypothetical protein
MTVRMRWPVIQRCGSVVLAEGAPRPPKADLPTSISSCVLTVLSIERSVHLRVTCIEICFHESSNLVDSASSIRLSQRLSHACLSINYFML